MENGRVRKKQEVKEIEEAKEAEEHERGGWRRAREVV